RFGTLGPAGGQSRISRRDQALQPDFRSFSCDRGLQAAYRGGGDALQCGFWAWPTAAPAAPPTAAPTGPATTAPATAPVAAFCSTVWPQADRARAPAPASVRTSMREAMRVMGQLLEIAQ